MRNSGDENYVCTMVEQQVDFMTELSAGTQIVSEYLKEKRMKGKYTKFVTDPRKRQYRRVIKLIDGCCGVKREGLSSA